MDVLSLAAINGASGLTYGGSYGTWSRTSVGQEKGSNVEASNEYDVVICGAGLAGLTLARQLKERMPELRMVLLDRVARPLPPGTFKVGESLTEVGTFYLAEVLGLRSYMERAHVKKLGLRFFLGNAHGPVSERPEIGLTKFPDFDTYQIDRGVLETDLRRLVTESGVELLEGCLVQDATLATGGAELHEVHYKADGGRIEALKCRWLIDAMGRRRFIQRKLDLGMPSAQKHNAVWFRLPGRIDVEDLVSKSEREWHERVPGQIRYNSTNHLMGDGYWVWLIPLSSEMTSVGIVALDSRHPFVGFNTFERATAWLRRYEPHLAAYIAGREPADFCRMIDYTYASKQTFSMDRWTCVGEAGVFADPLYSPGIELIGFSNCITTDLIAADLKGELTEERVQHANQFYLSLNDILTRRIQCGYQLFAHDAVAAAKTFWDFLSGWSLTAPQMFNQIFLRRECSSAVYQETSRYYPLAERVHKLFADWAMRPHRMSFSFFDYLSIPFLLEARTRNLRVGKGTEELVADHRKNMETIEQLAQVLFLLAVEDTMPEQLADLPEPLWLNAWAISLDPSKWKEDGLFTPTTPKRDLRPMWNQIRNLFSVSEKPAVRLRAQG